MDEHNKEENWPKFASGMPRGKYAFSPFYYSNRTWPEVAIKKAPVWCSVDLRDGNQALINPMNMAKKLEMFQMLVEIGFKEIEVGFPAASEIEYNFLRKLIDDDLIPEDVTVQVLTQAREHLIEKSMEALKGTRRAIIHLYNSTSIAQREQVFAGNKQEIIDIALNGVRSILKNINAQHGQIVFQYSPESFTGTEPEFALDICQQVYSEWKKNSPNDEKIIINLPATVELFGPHLYADCIEWFCKNFSYRENVIISLHTHNDRGTGIAASELGLQAGADRIEGTLFGNGERTGNVDIVTLALNLATHNVDPKLNFTSLPQIVDVSNRCTELDVPMRHPYAGELVFTAFSGSHQDAVKKGFAHRAKNPTEIWNLPYLAIDPNDIGRSYKAIIRINSQSGKGGVAYIMEKKFGYVLPKGIQPNFQKIVQRYTDASAKEVSAEEIKQLFTENYVSLSKLNSPIRYVSMLPNYASLREVKVELKLAVEKKLLFEKGLQGEENSADSGDGYHFVSLIGMGNGPIDATKNALFKLVKSFNLEDYSEHTLSKSSNADAIAYIEIDMAGRYFGVGIDSNITVASVKALLAAVNRALVKA